MGSKSLPTQVLSTPGRQCQVSESEQCSVVHVKISICTENVEK